jgi:hypothetical protein
MNKHEMALFLRDLTKSIKSKKCEVRRYSEMVILLLQIPGCIKKVKTEDCVMEQLDSTVCLFVVHGDDPVLFTTDISNPIFLDKFFSWMNTNFPKFKEGTEWCLIQPNKELFDHKGIAKPFIKELPKNKRESSLVVQLI